MNHYQILFDYLRLQGITLDSLQKKVHSLSPEKLFVIVNQLIEYTNKDKVKAESYFNFMPNSRLSGGPYLDSTIETRLSSSDELIRDSLLFADVIWIKNPIDPYFHCSEGYFCTSDSKDELIADLLMLFQYRLLLENGFARICATDSHFCHDCLMGSIAYDDVPEKYRKIVNKIENTICKEFINKVKFSAYQENGKFFVKVDTQEDDLLESSSNIIELTEYGFEPVLERAAKRKSGRVFKTEVRDSTTLYCELMRPIIDDVLMYNWFANQNENKLSYLTNRNVDAQSMNLISSNRTKKRNIGLSKSLSHSIPKILNVPINRIIELRKNESEAFENYRFYMDKVLKDIQDKNIDDNQIGEAMGDLVLPSINKMNVAVKNNKEKAGRGLLTNVVIGGGSVLLGMFDNILPSNMAGPLMALGVSNHGAQAIQNLRNVFNNDSSQRDQNFYFLWKVMR